LKATARCRQRKEWFVSVSFVLFAVAQEKLGVSDDWLFQSE